MAGTITTYEHCIVDAPLAYTGSKEDIVLQFYTWRFDEGGSLWAKQKYCFEQKFHSYGDCFTEEEKYKDIINFLFNRLKAQYKYYRNIGF
jgi:hypothetical protein